MGLPTLAAYWPVGLPPPSRRLSRTVDGTAPRPTVSYAVLDSIVVGLEFCFAGSWRLALFPIIPATTPSFTQPRFRVGLFLQPPFPHPPPLGFHPSYPTRQITLVLDVRGSPTWESGHWRQSGGLYLSDAGWRLPLFLHTHLNPLFLRTEIAIPLCHTAVAMRIGCLQFAPVKGDVNNNLSRADAVLLKENAENLDLLVLPELAFSGTSRLSHLAVYPTTAGDDLNDGAELLLSPRCFVLTRRPLGCHFKSLQDIYPHLEPTGSGISSLWARTIALKYGCSVVLGYPEKVDVSSKWPASPEYYNSAIVINDEGETVGGYRKNHLYGLDETWALEGGDGFFTGEVGGYADTTIGISMDIT